MTVYLGTVQAFGFGFAPRDWLPCNGQLLSISANQALFSLLGTTYGGNGVENFALPKIAPIASEGPGYFICTNGQYPPRSA